jgi:iron-sulfur cluster repair protein YtfE (RIC family)
MDVLEHLTEEHRKAERLMEQLEKTEPGPTRDRLVKELTDALTTHMAVEERFVYPIVVDMMGDEPETEAQNEHDLARQGLVNLDELRGEPGFGAALEMVKAGITHHVEEEEHDIFPKLREKAAGKIAALDPEELEQKVEAGDASGKTKDELYQQAREADIPGRSTMTKDELAKAVASDG